MERRFGKMDLNVGEKMSVVTGNTEYFKGISQIQYDGKDSDNPLAFKWYNKEQVVAGKTMNEHFRFAVAYWHSFCGVGSDPFGPGTQQFPWADGMMLMSGQKIKWMQHLSLLQRSERHIIVFMILIWLRKEIRLPNLLEDLKQLQNMQS